MNSPYQCKELYLTDRAGISNPPYKKTRKYSADLRKKAEIFKDSYLEISAVKTKNKTPMAKRGEYIVGNYAKFETSYHKKATIIDPVLLQKEPYRKSKRIHKSPKQSLFEAFKDENLQKEYEHIQQLFKK